MTPDEEKDLLIYGAVVHTVVDGEIIHIPLEQWYKKFNPSDLPKPLHKEV